MFDSQTPFNDLPDLPPAAALESPAVLRAAIAAHRALGELKGRGALLPNPSILVNALTLQEARLSSEIEGIVTTTDQLYRALSVPGEADDAHTKEVLRYREALWHGVRRMREGRPLATVLFEEIVQTISQNTAGVREGLGTQLQDQGTGQIVYTPPIGADLIRDKLANLETFLHAENGPDPLVRLAVAHYQFEAIHPFSDGNGRTGRILNILYLLHEGLLTEPILYPSRYIIQHKSDYYRLLRTVTEQNDWESWILYMLEAIRAASTGTLSRIEAIRELMDDFAERVRTLDSNAYSKDLVELLFHSPYCKTQFVIDAGLAKRQTASKYLQTLSQGGLLSTVRVGREIIYINSEFLELLSIPFVE